MSALDYIVESYKNSGDVGTIYGKPLEDLTREEAIACVYTLGKALERANKNHMATLDMWDVFRKARR